MKYQRWEIILKYIVEDFIATAQPVGSKSLLKKHKLNYSSATIRNEMMHLEELGYIDKTHTSSGRVPSVAGYRYYVERLRSEKLDKTIRYELDQLVDSSKSIEDILNESCEMLSKMTNLASCFFGPSFVKEKMVKLEIISLGDRRFTLLFLTNKGYCENRTFLLPENGSIKRLSECSEIMNNIIHNQNLVEIFEVLEQNKDKLKNYQVEYSFISHLMLSMLKDFLVKRNSDFFGKNYLLEQPEFKDNPDEIRELVKFLSNPYKVASMFGDEKETYVSIGCGKNQDISIITKNINVPYSDVSLGKIAVVGPNRMDYDKVLKYLDYVADMVSGHLNGIKETR